MGALLLFAIAIINLSLYQIFVVSDQNREIEFQHSQIVESNMVDARNALLEAATGDQSFVEIDLAPSYPARTLFVNPGTPAGTVRTTEKRSISVINNSDSTSNDITGGVCPGTAETRALQYRSGYNVYDGAPTLRVENTLLFQQFDDQTVAGSGQQLVAGDSINLLPVRNAYAESGSGAASVEPVPGRSIVTDVTNPEVQVPTAVGEDTWEDTLDGTVPSDRITVTGTGDSRTLTLELDGQYDLYCNPIGLNGAPPSGARKGGLSGGADGDNAGNINPASRTDVRLTDVGFGANKQEVVVTFKNSDDEPKEFARGRIPFYYSSKGSDPDRAILEGNNADELVIGADFERIDETISVPPNGGTKDVTFDFQQNAGNDFYVFSVVFDDGTAGDYYVDISNSGSGSGPTADASNSADAVDEGNTGQLDGSASTANGGSIDSYEWSLPGSPPDGVTITDSDAGTPEATFDASGATVSSDTDVAVELTVTDNKGNTDTDTVTVTVRDTDGGSGGSNQAPSVTVDSVTYDNSNNQVIVDYTPKDSDGNLDSAEIVVTNDSGAQVDDSPRSVDLTGEEGQSQTETFSGSGIGSSTKPFDVEVTVTDTDGATGSGSGST